MASFWTRVGLAAVSVGLISSLASAQVGAAAVSPDGAWQRLESMPAAVLGAPPWIRPALGHSLTLDLAMIAGQLAAAPQEADPNARNAAIVLTLPDADGGWQSFRVVESALLEPELAAQFPMIKTYRGQGLDDPSATIDFDVTPRGFRAQVLSAKGRWYIDPVSRDDTQHYSAYYARHLKAMHRWACAQMDEPLFDKADGVNDGATLLRAGPTLRTYRMAVGATGEYTQFHGGTVPLALAAITTTVNRIAGIFRRELAISFTLVNNNNLIIFTDPSTDPYTNSDVVALLGQNQTTCDSIIMSANYNIGHVLGVGGGGVAQLGSVCRTGNKARGVSTLGAPVGDAFDVDYVAHEVGHQFNAAHTFNGSLINCGSNLSASSAFEPGSGTTIMAYAGICGGDNVQLNSDAMFHSRSFDQIRNFVESGSGSGCGINTSTGNVAPIVNAGPDLVIPRGTPFTLTASATDANGDELTYSFEQRDLGPQQTLAAKDVGAGPLFRTLLPTTSPSRTFPRASVIRDNANIDPSNVEELPALGRIMNMRVTARDNRDTGGGVNTDDLVITVAGAAGPFAVTSPNGGNVIVGDVPVAWNPAGTSVAPVNTATVNILLSTDGGFTFPDVLAADVPNDGLELVTFPSISTSTARLRIEAVGNVYFDLSDGNFTIAPPITGTAVESTGINTINDSAGNGNNNGRLDPGESSIGIGIQLTNKGLTTATGVVATLESLTPTCTVVAAVASYADIPRGQLRLNLTPFVIALAPDHPCGTPISLKLTISTNQSPAESFLALSTGAPGGLLSPVAFSYGGPVVAIPEFPNDGVAIPITVGGLSGPVGDIEFSFDGAACNTDPGSETVGLDHTWVGDLDITLVSPGGLEVNLLNRPGGPVPGSPGNNFCGTRFSDLASASIQSIGSGEAPHTGTYSPLQQLFDFRGQLANGNWTLRVRDLAGADTGSVRAFTLFIRTRSSTTCQSPNTLTCFVDFNFDGFLNQEDLGGFLTAFLIEPDPLPGPSGTNRMPCPGEPMPYDVQGYAADYNRDCSLNQEDLSGFLTEYFSETEVPAACVPG